MSVSERKIKSLIEEGFEEIGVILQKDGKRVTVDKFGRVQWWTTSGAGEMVSSHAGENALNQDISRLKGIIKTERDAVIKLHRLLGDIETLAQSRRIAGD